MDAFFHFLDVVVLCVTGLIALVLVLIVAVCYLPDSPVKDVMSAVTKRIGATAAVAAVGIPIEPIPGLDGLYDIGALLFLAVYWFGVLKEIRDALRRRKQREPVIDGEAVETGAGQGSGFAARR
jgi:hypothetical protein